MTIDQRNEIKKDYVKKVFNTLKRLPNGVLVLMDTGQFDI